jgi:proline iminopeptidase
MIGKLVAAVIVGALVAFAVSAEPAKPFTRDDAARIIANARRILNPEGIERLQTVKIGGIDQWVSVRGRDRRNPVLFVIHGGPGYMEMPMNWWSFRDEEEYFTVVQWDQRGAGKTWILNDPKTVAPTMTLKQSVADAEEMVEWLRGQLGKKKIFLLGHSAGTYAGLQIAQRHPDWLYAYIGVGQMADMPESERRGWKFAMAAARRAGNTQAILELESIAPYFPPGHDNPLKDLYLERKWVGYFGGVMAYRRDSDADTDLGKLSPDYTTAELARIWESNDYAERYLLKPLIDGNWGVPRLDCPVILLEGRHDYNANAEVAAEWLARLNAPSKKIVWFEHSGHMPMMEEPGKFFLSLVRYARPFAEHAGDAAPVE